MSFPVVGRVYVGHRGGDAAFGHDGVCLSKERFTDHADGEETAPGEEHVALVQKGGEAPGFEAGAAECGAREAVELASGEVAKRMAGKRVEREQRDVEGEDERADTDAEVAAEKEGANGVVPEKNDEQNRQVKEIAMDILEDKRKSGLAAIVAARGFADGAGGRVQEKRAVVGFAVVVAGGAKAQRANKNEERRREWPPVMQGIDERRIKRREVRAPLVIPAFEGAQRGINAETT